MLGNKETKLGAQIVAWGAPTYERPDEWIALPELSVGDERLVGLMRVNDATNNHVAILCAGDYTVDWGDGNVENFASGAKAEHTYTFADVDAETETAGGWRQAIISVTPQAGAALTTVNLDQTTGDTYTQGWLDVAVAGTAIGTIEIGGTTKPPTLLEQFEFVGDNSVTSMYQMFYGCSSLQSIPTLDTSNVTSMYRMFYGCSSLEEAILNGAQYSVSITNCNFERTPIVALFESLGTAAAGTQTITVTSNPGTSELDADDIAIATDKGWEVAA
jgi:surface protein